MLTGGLKACGPRVGSSAALGEGKNSLAAAPTQMALNGLADNNGAIVVFLARCGLHINGSTDRLLAAG